MNFKSWRMVCKISIPIDFLFKKYNPVGNVPYLVEYGYFPTVINVYFSTNCLHFFRRTIARLQPRAKRAGLKAVVRSLMQ